MKRIDFGRNQARYGKTPANLESLVLGLLAQLPRDFMNGQPLRYKRGEEGSYCLYSVGEDAQDNLGDATRRTSESRASAWDGGDWVWPRLVTN